MWTFLIETQCIPPLQVVWWRRKLTTTTTTRNEVSGSSETVQNVVFDAMVLSTRLREMRRATRFPLAHAPLPLSAFLFEWAAVFTAAAEYIGDLRDKTGEHGLQHDHRRRQHRHIYRPHMKRIHRWRWSVSVAPLSLPLAVFLLVHSAVLAASAENVHNLGYEAGKHRLETREKQHQWCLNTQWIGKLNLWLLIWPQANCLTKKRVKFNVSLT